MSASNETVRISFPIIESINVDNMLMDYRFKGFQMN